jgi:transmembrane protein 33
VSDVLTRRHEYRLTECAYLLEYYDPSMKLVAYVELAIFARVLLGLFLRRNSLLMPIVYALFLRSRYFQSPFTRQAFASLDAAILQGLQHPQAASFPQLKTYYDIFKGYLGRAMGTVLVAADQPQRAAPGAAATSTGASQ